MNERYKSVKSLIRLSELFDDPINRLSEDKGEQCLYGNYLWKAIRGIEIEKIADEWNGFTETRLIAKIVARQSMSKSGASIDRLREINNR